MQVPDGIIYVDPNVIRFDGSDTFSYSNGMTCILDTNYVFANAAGGYNHSTSSCTGP